MKVLEINVTYGFASTGLIAKDIGDLLITNGDEVRYAYKEIVQGVPEGYKIGNLIDWKLHALYTRVFGMQGWGSRCATKHLINYIDSEKPDVVHLHNLHSNYINLPLLLKFLSKSDISTIVTLHDCWNFTGKCCHFALAECLKWKSGCGHCPKIRSSPRSLFFDRTSEVVAKKKKMFREIKNLTVVGCSKWISKMASESLVFRGYNVQQIYNGVDTEVFNHRNQQMCREYIGINCDFMILGIANKWLSNENHILFNEIVSILKNNEILILIGCSDEQKNFLSRFPNIKAIGYVNDRETIAKYYCAADVFINPTFEDTLPTVNMESLCCGTPVVTYDACGSGELILDGFGEKVCPGDWQAILKALQRIKENRYRVDYECCKKMFDKKNAYVKYVELFHTMKHQN